MYMVADSLDDLLLRVYKKLLRSKNRAEPTRGATSEEIGAMLKLQNPRARLSRTERKGTVFSCLGEFLWYLAASDDLPFIKYYTQEGYTKDACGTKRVKGAYGPRLFLPEADNQYSMVVKLLRAKRNTRRAVIQLFDRADIKNEHGVPCTCTLQFLIRRQRLEMVVYMRSNDAFWGLPHDIFAFTMLQELVARDLQIELGPYHHCVGSLHLYDKHREKAEQFIAEGWQRSTPMPPMPLVDPWPSVKELLRLESRIRKGRIIDFRKVTLNSYWKDLAKLLQIYGHFVNRKAAEIAPIRNTMSTKIYNAYIAKKKAALSNKQKAEVAVQQDLL